MLRVASILDTLLHWAPASLAWDKDNIGLLVGSPGVEVARILVCLDVTEAVVEEAISLRADLIVAHHPIIFRPLHAIRTDTPQGRMLDALLRGGVAVIAMHTNADAAPDGLNRALASRLGLTKLRPLEQARDQLRRLELRLASSPDAVEKVGHDLEAAGAASWHAHMLGNGNVLLAVDAMSAAIGRIRSAVDDALGEAVLSRRVFALENALEQGGIGMVGELQSAMAADAFLEHVRQRLGCERLRATHAPSATRIQRVAVCGGAGSSYVRAAIASGAQCFVTGDLTHHTFLDYGGDILLVDAGHFETEQVFVELCASVLESAPFQDSEKIDILRVRTNTNPVRFV
jgi:dinuclear metal center YbgI/SA1388 family protein